MADPQDDFATPIRIPDGPGSPTTPKGGNRTDSGVSSQPSEPAPIALAVRYDVLAQVGRGGMGVVYRARDRETDEIVALKVLRPEIAARPDFIERFKSELRLARKITHKHVCRTHELLRFGDTVVIAMEFVVGDSLRDVLKRFGGAPLRRGVDWLRQMCSALGEAHAQGIVHRDLKPENVLVDHDGQVRIMDFGIARSIETEATESGAIIGTPAYMSPEQAEGKPVDARSDIYSLGLIAYEMFVGRQAFHADTAAALVRKRLGEAPPPPRSVEPYLPDFLERVILKCLERDPAKRYASVAELERALAAEGQAPEDEPAELPAHLTHGRASDALWLAAGAGGLAAFLFAASYGSPECLVRLRLTGPMVLERAQELLTARGWPPPSAPTLAAMSDVGPYELLARRFGNDAARSRLRSDFPHVLLQARFGKAENPRETAASVTYEPDGAIRSIELPVLGFVPGGSPGLPKDEALALAQQELKKVFDLEAAHLALEQEGTLTEGTRRGHTFRWTEPDPSGIRKQYQVNVFDRIIQVKKEHKLPEDFVRRSSGRFTVTAFFAWFAALLLLFFLRRVYADIRRREAISLALIGLFASAGAIGSGTDLAAWILIGALLAGWGVVVSATVCSLQRRVWPHAVASYVSLLRHRPGVPVALAVSRGAAFGLLVLGARVLLQRSGVAWDLTWPLPSSHSQYLGATLKPLVFWGEILGVSFVLTFLLAFLVSLAGRLTNSPTLLAIVGGLSWAALDLGASPVDGFAIASQFAAAAAFSLILIHFDLLTLIASVLTFALWGKAYPLLRMLETIGDAPVLLFLGLWGLGVLAALYFGFRPALGRIGRRASDLLR